VTERGRDRQRATEGERHTETDRDRESSPASVSAAMIDYVHLTIETQFRDIVRTMQRIGLAVVIEIDIAVLRSVDSFFHNYVEG